MFAIFVGLIPIHLPEVRPVPVVVSPTFTSVTSLVQITGLATWASQESQDAAPGASQYSVNTRHLDILHRNWLYGAARFHAFTCIIDI